MVSTFYKYVAKDGFSGEEVLNYIISSVNLIPKITFSIFEWTSASEP